MPWKPSASERKRYAVDQKEKSLSERLKDPRLRLEDLEKYEEMKRNLPKKPPGKNIPKE